MAARGRTKAFVMSDEHRVKIQNSNILNALVEHACGEREMSATQVSAGLGLLKKVLPDISQVTLQGDADKPVSIAFKTVYEVKSTPSAGGRTYTVDAVSKPGSGGGGGGN